MLPAAIRAHIEGLHGVTDEIGRSRDTLILFEKRFILKISDSPERLRREKERIDWLQDRLPVSRSVCFCEENGRAYYLRTYLDGTPLCDAHFLRDPALIIRLLTQALNMLRTLDAASCPFASTDSVGDGFVHGDLCLPNILIDAHDQITGFIDLDNAGRGDPWYDIAWTLWSLAYNLKTAHYAPVLLDSIGVAWDAEKFAQYIPNDTQNALIKESFP